MKVIRNYVRGEGGGVGEGRDVGLRE